VTPDQVRGDGDPVRDDECAPLIVTAELPADLHAWANALRRAHYPPERNQVDAHVTLFHGLPPSCEDELQGLLAAAARDHAPVSARLEGVMALGGGTALRIASPAMLALRRDIAGRLHGLLTAQDEAAPRLHVTLQNKVSAKEARALQIQLSAQIAAREFRFSGLALHRYRGGPWEAVKRWSFRG
jgi:hypothetical protein